MSKSTSLLALFGFVVFSLLAALSGLLAPPGAWYASLQQPAYAPPTWVFGPVWTLLYVLIGLAAWRVWRRVGLRHPALLMWVVQWLLNASWSPIFFGLQSMGWALLQMTVLWLAIVTCIVLFKDIDRWAARLLWPYLAWVSFAWLLNLGFWWLN